MLSNLQLTNDIRDFFFTGNKMLGFFPTKKTVEKVPVTSNRINKSLKFEEKASVSDTTFRTQ